MDKCEFCDSHFTMTIIYENITYMVCNRHGRNMLNNLSVVSA